MGGLAVIYTGQFSPQHIIVTVLPFLVVFFAHYLQSHFTSLANTMPYEDAVEIDRMKNIQLIHNFDAEYYVDPILKESVDGKDTWLSGDEHVRPDGAVDSHSDGSDNSSDSEDL